MINLLDEIEDLLKSYNLNINDLVFVVDGSAVRNPDFLYNYDRGRCNFENIQLIVDDYTWFERTSYDGREKFILKAHPLMSTFKNQESHTDYFYR